MARQSPEHLLQCQLIERVRFELVPLWPELRGPNFEDTGALRLLAIPNGDGRPIRAAVRVKMEGGQSGVPDLLLPIPRGGFHSAWIELKSTKGKPSKNQKDWLAFLQQQGHAVLISKDLEEALLFLAHYMAGALPAAHQEDASVLIAKEPSNVHGNTHPRPPDGLPHEEPGKAGRRPGSPRAPHLPRR